MSSLRTKNCCSVGLLLLIVGSCYALFADVPDLMARASGTVIKSARTVAHGARDPQSAPDPVEYFNAYAASSSVDLDWHVVSERNVDGFRIYRQGDSTAYVLINRDGLIPVWQDQYNDAHVKSNRDFSYVLGVVLSDGSEFLSQPVQVHTAKTAKSN